jgi:hypothetical protein
MLNMSCSNLELSAKTAPCQTLILGLRTLEIRGVSVFVAYAHGGCLDDGIVNGTEVVDS